MDLWTEATRDLDAEVQALAMTAARNAMLPYWPMLAQASSGDDLGNRLALIGDRLDATAARFAPEGVEPSVFAVQVGASLIEDWHALASVRRKDSIRRRAGFEFGASRRTAEAHPTVKGIVIEMDKTVREVTVSSLADMQAIVKGLIEPITLRDGSTMYVNEEGLYQFSQEDRRGFNSIASDVALATHPQPVVGPALVVGPLNDDGYDTDVTDWARRFIRKVMNEAGGRMASRRIATKCSDCGQEITQDGEGGAWHKGGADGPTECPRGGTHTPKRSESARTAVSLTNVGVDRETGNGVGTDPSGKRVQFKLSDADREKLKSILYSDLAVNFSGVDVSEDEIIATAAAPQNGGNLRSLGLPSAACLNCGSVIVEKDGTWVHANDLLSGGTSKCTSPEPDPDLGVRTYSSLLATAAVVETSAGGLKPGDVWLDPSTLQTGPEGEDHYTVDSVQNLGTMVIIDFKDGTATAPVPAESGMTVRRGASRRSRTRRQAADSNSGYDDSHGASRTAADQGLGYLDDDPCSACGGPLVYVGTLGNRAWFRCRNCGLDQSQEVGTDEPMLAAASRVAAGSTAMECLECGAKFSRKITPSTTEVKCPKCGGYDTNVDMERAPMSDWTSYASLHTGYSQVEERSRAGADWHSSDDDPHADPDNPEYYKGDVWEKCMTCGHPEDMHRPTGCIAPGCNGGYKDGPCGVFKPSIAGIPPGADDAWPIRFSMKVASDESGTCANCGAQITRGPGQGRRAWRHGSSPGQGEIACSSGESVATPKTAGANPYEPGANPYTPASPAEPFSGMGTPEVRQPTAPPTVTEDATKPNPGSM